MHAGSWAFARTACTFRYGTSGDIYDEVVMRTCIPLPAIALRTARQSCV